MKNILILTLLVVLAPFLLVSQTSDFKFNDMNNEANPKHHSGRKYWLESMHRTEPGVDYKILRKEFLKSRVQMNNDSRKLLPNNPPELLKYVSENGKISGTWKERGSNNQSGRIHCADVDLDDGLIYAASAGGNVWRGTITGENWTCLNNSTQFSISSIKVESVDDFRRIYVFDRDNLYYSDNEGFSWEAAKGLENIAKWGQINRGTVLNNSDGRTIYVLAEEWDYEAWKHIVSVYYSIDDGINFSRIFSVDNTQSIDIWGVEHSIGEFGYKDNVGNITTANNQLFCYHKDTLFSISGSDKQILNILDDIKVTNPSRIKLSGTDANNKITLFINAYNQNNSPLTTYVSTDLGNSVKKKAEAPENYFMNNSFAVSKLSADKSYIGGVHCHYSLDGANSWKSFNSWPEYYGDPLNKLHADIPGIKSFRTSETDEFFLISTDGGLYKTLSDSTVENISLNNLNVSQYYSIYSYNDDNGGYILAGSQDQGFQKSELFKDKILDFEQTISGDYGSLTSGNGGRSLWTVYPGFAMFYENTSSQELISKSWNFNKLSSAKVWMPPIAAVPGDPYSAYIAPGASEEGSSKIWLLSYDNTLERIKTYELPFKFNSTEDPDNYVTAIAVSPIDVNFVYALTRQGKFYTSKDGGLTWVETLEFIGPGYNWLHGTSIYPSKRDLGTVYIAGSGYSNPAVFVSKDSGQTFTALEGLPPAMVYQIDMNFEEDVLFAASSLGPYIYVINQEKWYHIAGLDAPEQNYWSVNFIPDRNIARFATYGRGIWDFEIEKIITDVDNFVDNQISELEVYPNPTSANMSIQFKHNIGEYAKIELLDMEGRLIKTLFEGILQNDTNTQNINLSEIDGLSSGNYIVIFSSHETLKYKKISYIK